MTIVLPLPPQKNASSRLPSTPKRAQTWTTCPLSHPIPPSPHHKGRTHWATSRKHERSNRGWDQRSKAPKKTSAVCRTKHYSVSNSCLAVLTKISRYTVLAWYQYQPLIAPIHSTLDPTREQADPAPLDIQYCPLSEPLRKHLKRKDCKTLQMSEAKYEED